MLAVPLTLTEGSTYTGYTALASQAGSTLTRSRVVDPAAMSE